MAVAGGDGIDMALTQRGADGLSRCRGGTHPIDFGARRRRLPAAVLVAALVPTTACPPFSVRQDTCLEALGVIGDCDPGCLGMGFEQTERCHAAYRRDPIGMHRTLTCFNTCGDDHSDLTLEACLTDEPNELYAVCSEECPSLDIDRLLEALCVEVVDP